MLTQPHRLLKLLTTAFVLVLGLAPRPAQSEPLKIVVIKGDDVKEVNDRWENYFKFAQDNGLKVTAGIICNSLENPPPEYTAWLKKWRDSGVVEFWLHGWDHQKIGEKDSEFSGSGYEHQKTALARSQEAAARVFGQPFTTLGTPFNGMDSDTARAFRDTPGLKLIFCYPGQPALKELPAEVIQLPMTLRGEADGTGQPNFEKFKAAYASKKDSVTLAAIQFHPPHIPEAKFKEMTDILAFLKAEGWTFMTASQYADHLAKQPKP